VHHAFKLRAHETIGEQKEEIQIFHHVDPYT